MNIIHHESERDKALTIIYGLIEQVNGLGYFKKLSDLDQVRKAFSTITTDFDTLEISLKNAIEQNSNTNLNRSENSK